MPRMPRAGNQKMYSAWTTRRSPAASWSNRASLKTQQTLPPIRSCLLQKESTIRNEAGKFPAVLGLRSILKNNSRDQDHIGIGCKFARTNNRASRNSPRFQLGMRSEEHTSELQSRLHLVCRLLLE